MATDSASGSAKSATTPRTVESLGAEVDELRRMVTELSARLDGATGKAKPPISKAKAAAPAAAAAAVTVAATTPTGAPEDDPIRAMRSVLTAAFEQALAPIPDDPDEADAHFARFVKLIHSSRCGTPLLEQSLRNYTWRQLRRNAPIYLDDNQAPGSFECKRITPDNITARTEQAKFFLLARTRMPTPITFRRDSADGGAWRIEASSL
ncbi:MAG: hypothetical protein KC502_20140 [Myxococcales bacterium]|nr:hypothetical protein [Myxococcales bacterium]